MNLFAYGTLMEARVFTRIVGRNVDSVAATVDGYQRFQFLNASYPGVVPAPGKQLKGRIYQEICAAEWARLDEFEGDMYDRVDVEAHTDTYSVIDAAVYVVKSHYRQKLSTHDWDFEKFLQNDLRRYL